VFNIDKTFEFCYGHRVWSQELDGRYSEDLKCACRHLHGHEAKVQVYLSGDKLERGMLTDFRHLEWLKKFFNTYVDHKFILDKSDPLFSFLVNENIEHIPLYQENSIVGWTLSEEDLNPEFAELYGGMLIVDFVPTSENLARWVHKIVSDKMRHINVMCSRVDWWETPKSRSSYVETVYEKHDGVSTKCCHHSQNSHHC